MNHTLLTILFSILPFSELRLGLPYALLNGSTPYQAYLLSVIPNILIIFVIFFFLDYLHRHFIKIKIYENLFTWYIKRIRRKTSSMISAWAYFALFILVAIPLPGTGAYTGCLASWLFNMDRRKSILAIIMGVLFAGILVLLASLGLIKLF